MAEEMIGPVTMGEWAEQVLTLGSEFAFAEFEIRTSIPRALIFHGALCLALRHPDVPALSRSVIESMADNLETILEDRGVRRPKGGWRAMVPEEPRNWTRHVECTGNGEIVEVHNVQLWICGGCGFAFDAVHTDDTPEGGYSCPACVEPWT